MCCFVDQNAEIDAAREQVHEIEVDLSLIHIYDNVRSAVAEEGLLRMLFREPALLAQTEGLTAEDFSVPLFGRVYAALRERWQNDLAITPAALADSLSPAEMAHLM